MSTSILNRSDKQLYPRNQDAIFGVSVTQRESPSTKIAIWTNCGIYLHHDNPAVHASVRLTHSLGIVTTFRFVQSPSVIESTLFDISPIDESKASVGFERPPRADAMGGGVRNNMGATLAHIRLRDGATSQYNDHLTTVHTVRHSFGPGIQLKFAIPNRIIKSY